MLTTIGIEVAIYIGVYILGAWSFPKLRLRWLMFWRDPKGVIEQDIANLRALSDRIKGKTV